MNKGPHCYHDRPDPRCMATQQREQNNPLAAMGIGPKSFTRAEQNHRLFCCRCGHCASQVPYKFMAFLILWLGRCKADPEGAAADALIADLRGSAHTPTSADMDR